MRTYNFNENTAEKADSSSSGIRTTGAYILEIRQCAAETSPRSDSKAEWLTFVLGSQDGTKVITRLVTAKSDGSDAFGLAIFQSLMGLLNIQTCEPKPMKVYQLNGSSSDGYRIPAVEKKTVGVLLQYQEEKDQDGYAKLNEKGYARYQMVCKAFFDPKTRLTIGEKAKGITKAERIDKLVASLEDVRGKSPSVDSQSFESPTPARASAPASSAPATPASVADDIPF
jgi:hypothetical protein